MPFINPRGQVIGSGGGPDTNLYNTDGSLSAARTVGFGAFDLTFTGTGCLILPTVIKGPGIVDTDADTGIYLEQSADEDRGRIESGSTFHAAGTKFIGHFDDEGFEVRSFNADFQPLTANDEIDTGDSNGWRGECRVHRGALNEFKGLPTNGVVPGLTAGLTGVSALMTAGRTSQLRSVGAFITAANGVFAGIFDRTTANRSAFCGVTSTDLWFRYRDNSANENYLRMSGTRLEIALNLSGTGTPNTGAVLCRDNTHFNSSGAEWRPPFTAEYLRGDVGTGALANQTFDATLRGVSWGSIVTNAGGTGETTSGFGVGQTTSSLSTPAASSIPATDCTAFDLNGGSAAVTGVAAVEVFVELAFEVQGTPTGESVYELQWWDNNQDVLHNQGVKRISFNADTTYQSIAWATQWPNVGTGTPASGSLGYSQIELRVQRISGSDDIDMIDDGSSIFIRRVA